MGLRANRSYTVKEKLPAPDNDDHLQDMNIFNIIKLR